MYMKFEIEIPKQTCKFTLRKPCHLESRKQKNPIWPPGGHFENDVAENPMYISIVPLKFEVDIQSQPKN